MLYHHNAALYHQKCIASRGLYDLLDNDLSFRFVVGTSSNIESNSSSTQEDDVYMLRKLLNCSLIEKDIIRMV